MQTEKGRRRFSTRLLAFTGLYAALSAYWLVSYDYHFSGTDEFFVFTNFARASDPAQLVGFIFTPHNRHFAPLFKAFFYLEYVLFGPDSAPYHAVTIGLFAISAVLFWKFLKNETGDWLSAGFFTTVYATTTTYYSIVTWVFLQSFLFTSIFLMLSLLRAQKSLATGGGFKLSGLYCLLSSLSLSFGAASWLFTSIYFVLGRRALRPAEGPSRGVAVAGLLSLAVSAVATVLLYGAFLRNVDPAAANEITTSPMLLAKGTVIMLGDIIIDNFGVFHLLKALADRLQGSTIALMPVLRAAIAIAFFTGLGLSLYLMLKLPARLRASSLAGISLSLLSTAMIMAASLSAWGYNPYEVTNIIRYKYFPSFFLFAGVAPFLAAAGRRLRAACMVVLPFWVAWQAYINHDLLTMNADRIYALTSLPKLVNTSVEHPIFQTPEGNYVAVSERVPYSREVVDYVFFKGQPMHYVDILDIYKKPDEIITCQGEKCLYLKEFRAYPPAEVAATPAAAARHKGGAIKVSSEANATLSIKKLQHDPTPFQHLHLRIKAARPSSGALVYTTPEGRETRQRFDIQESAFHKRYLLPAPMGSALRVELGPGEYSVKDVRVYY